MSTKILKQGIVPCADHYTQALQRKQKRRLFEEWRAGIPSGLFTKFITNGLPPFLAKHGYTLNQSTDQLVQYCVEWAFAHVWMSRKKQSFLQRTFMKQFHDGGEEDFDWFYFSIPMDDWEELADAWSCPEFLDDSDAGTAQRLDCPMFVWNILDLGSSRRHMKWMAMNDLLEDDETHYLQSQAITDESMAFGGDRRTH